MNFKIKIIQKILIVSHTPPSCHCLGVFLDEVFAEGAPIVAQSLTTLMFVNPLSQWSCCGANVLL